MRALTSRDCEVAAESIRQQFDALRVEVLAWEPRPYPRTVIDCTVEPDQERIYADEV